MGKYTSSTFYSGTRKLLGKQVIYSLHIHDGILYAGGSSVDASAGKIFSLPNKAVVGSFTTGLDIQRITINNDLIFTASKCGMIEVWLKERFARIASFRMANGGHAKITSLAADMDGGTLYAGSSDGRIQVRDGNYHVPERFLIIKNVELHLIPVFLLVILQVWALD